VADLKQTLYNDPEEAACGRRNRIAVLGFELLWGLGVPFVSSGITLPGYLKALGASGFLIGLVPALFAGGIAIIQPFSVYLIRPGPGRFRKMLWTYRIGASFYLAMAASALLLPAAAVNARLALFFACYAGFVLIAGAGDPHYVALIIASISPRERGWFFGLRLAWFGVGGLLGGALVSPVLRALPSPLNFGLGMLLGGSFILLATLWFARFKDKPHPEEGERPPLRACLADVWLLARRRRIFLIFLAATCLFVLAQGAFAFLALFIKERLNAGDTFLGQLNLVFMACSLGLGLALGRAGDRFGHRSTFLLGLALYIAGIAGTLTGQSAPVLLAAYFMAAAFSPTWAVSVFNLGYECAGVSDPARVYAGMSLVSAPLRIIAPLAAGAAVDGWGYPPVLIIAALLAGLTLALGLLLPKR